MRLWKAGALLLGALLLLSSCAHCKSHGFINDYDGRPTCRAASVKVEPPAPKVYTFVFPDNSVLPVPDGLTWRMLQCLKDENACVDEANGGAQFRAKKNEVGLPEGQAALWRI